MVKHISKELGTLKYIITHYNSYIESNKVIRCQSAIGLSEKNNDDVWVNVLLPEIKAHFADLPPSFIEDMLSLNEDKRPLVKTRQIYQLKFNYSLV